MSRPVAAARAVGAVRAREISSCPSLPRGIDEQTLKDIADMTGGEYYSATSAGELQKVFTEVPTDQIMTHEMMEVSALFAAIGAALAALAIFLSFLFNPIS